MFTVSTQNMIPAVLELTSKVRYGMTSRGVPLYRAIPYDSKLPPVIVGCSERDARRPHVGLIRVDDWSTPYQPGGSYPRGTLVQLLGQAGDPKVELAALYHRFITPAFPSKPVQPTPPLELFASQPGDRPPAILTGTTFNIDPPGCRDVDDVFTVFPPSTPGSTQWGITISITDVAKYIHPDTPCDQYAKRIGSSFYSPDGAVLYPMLPEELSIHRMSLLPNQVRPVIALHLVWDTEKKEWVGSPRWELAHVRVSRSYTYEEADAVLQQFSTESAAAVPLTVLAQAAGRGAEIDSHILVERLMVLYNKEAGALLKRANLGVLRQQDPAEESAMAALRAIGAPMLLAQKAALYVHPSTPTTAHAALGAEVYAHASSPLRRYVDLYNQRCIRQILHQEIPMGVMQPPPAEEFLRQQNERSRAAKRFHRELFSFAVLAQQPQAQHIQQTALCVSIDTTSSDRPRATFYVPAWKQTIRAPLNTPHIPFTPSPGQTVQFDWFADTAQVRWKTKLVFRFQLPEAPLSQSHQPHET